MTINELITEAHANAKDKGFWDEERNTGELLMLIVSECGEALEAHRKGRMSDVSKLRPLIDLRIVNADMMTWKNLFEDGVKDTFEDELADIVIRIADLCGYYGFMYYGPDITSRCLENGFNVGERLFVVTECICYATDMEGSDTAPLNKEYLERALLHVWGLANAMGINLWQHIELKMAYNRNRPRLHGKKY